MKKESYYLYANFESRWRRMFGTGTNQYIKFDGENIVIQIEDNP